MTIYYFTGEAKWAKVVDKPKSESFTYKGKTITKPAQWSIDLFMDAPSLKAFRNSDIQLKVREDKETENEYVSFHRNLMGKDKEGNEKENKPPVILDAEGNPMPDTKIGNGSNVTIKVEVFNTKMGPGTRLEAVRVNNLVPYEGNKVSEDTPIDVPF